MEELKRKKEILEAIKEAIANISLESDFNDIEITDDLVKNIESKVIKLGGKDVKLF